ncbi:MAG: class I SAM-dependent methyltransferase, partial [Nostoc sp.]
MEKIPSTVYDTISPYQWVTDVAHEAWKARDKQVWTNNIQDLIAPDAVILDAGCGLGRLPLRLWSAKKIVMVEPNLRRFLHTSLIAKYLINQDQELLKKLENDDFIQSNGYERLLQELYSSPLKSEKVHLINDVMQSKAISQYENFGLIVCSHIFEHISLDDLLQSLLTNPFNPTLQEIFGDEFKSESELYQLSATPLFTIKQWEAYHSEFYTHKNMQVGTYIEYLQIQARLYRL